MAASRGQIFATLVLLAGLAITGGLITQYILQQRYKKRNEEGASVNETGDAPVEDEVEKIKAGDSHVANPGNHVVNPPLLVSDAPTRFDDAQNQSDGAAIRRASLPTQDEVTEMFARIADKGGGTLALKDAQILVSLLTHNTTNDNLVKVLRTIGNCAAFTTSQNLLREAGCLLKLSQLLTAYNMASKAGYTVQRPVVVAMNGAIGNLSVNEENQKHLKETIPTLLDLTAESNDDQVKLSSLQALTNLSLLSYNHGHYTRSVQNLYEVVDTGSDALKIQALKVLVNLSSNPKMVPHLLAAKAPTCTVRLLSSDNDEAILLRYTTFLKNIVRTSQINEIESKSLPTDDKAPSPETMYAALYGVNNMSLRSKVFVLSQNMNEEIKDNANVIYSCLSST